jgi:iron complex transport system ATP-binding protein
MSAVVGVGGSSTERRPPVLCLRGVAVVRDGRPILDGVDWEVNTGERWVVIGPNGSGKTTLLHVAGMRLLPTRGVVEVLGERYGRTDARAVRKRLTLVSQATLRSLRPSLCAHDVVLTGRHAALEPWWHHYSAEDHERAAFLLEQAGFGHLGGHEFGVLSEGERQQVLLARALMSDPELLLLDEPAAGLDLGARERLIGRLAALAADPSTPPLVLVTHHVEEIPPGTTHAALMRRGVIAQRGPASRVLTSGAVSWCFDVSVEVECADGRFSVRASSGAPQADEGGQVGTDLDPTGA